MPCLAVDSSRMLAHRETYQEQCQRFTTVMSSPDADGSMLWKLFFSGSPETDGCAAELIGLLGVTPSLAVMAENLGNKGPVLLSPENPRAKDAACTLILLLDFTSQIALSTLDLHSRFGTCDVSFKVHCVLPFLIKRHGWELSLDCPFVSTRPQQWCNWVVGSKRLSIAHIEQLLRQWRLMTATRYEQRCQTDKEHRFICIIVLCKLQAVVLWYCRLFASSCLCDRDWWIDSGAVAVMVWS